MVQGQTALDGLLGGGSGTALEGLVGKKPTARKVRPPPSTLEHVAATALGNLSGGIERSASMLRKIGDRMVPDAIQPKPLPGVEAFFDQSPHEARGAIQSGLGVRESPDLQIKPGESPGFGDEKFWKTTVPGGIGDLASFALQTMALGPLGTAAGLGAKAGAFAAGTATGALAGSEESFQRTLADTGDESRAWEAAMYGGLLGTTEGLDVLVAGGLAKPLKRLVKGPMLAAIDKKLGGLFKQAVFGGAVEGLQESSQSLLSEFVARRLDDEEKAYLQDLKDSLPAGKEGGRLGFVLGVLLGSGGQLVRNTMDGDLVARPGEPGYVAPEPEALPDLPAETVQTTNLLPPRGFIPDRGGPTIPLKETTRTVREWYPGGEPRKSEPEPVRERAAEEIQGAIEAERALGEIPAGMESVPSRRIVLPSFAQPRSVEAEVAKSVVDIASGDPYGFSDLTKSEPFRAQGLRALDIPSQRVVLSSVARVIKDPQIRDRVVQGISVDVMHNLFGPKATAEMLLDDPSVFQDLPAHVSESSVPVRIDAADALVRAVADAAAKLPLAARNAAGVAPKRAAALGTDAVTGLPPSEAGTGVAAETGGASPKVVGASLERGSALGTSAIQHRATPRSSEVPGAERVSARSGPEIISGESAEFKAPAPSPTSSRAAEAVEPLGPDGQPATSTKNRIVQEEANARDLSLAEDEAVREFGPVWEEAGTKLAEDPSIGERVVKGEPVKGLHSDTRNAVLLREQITAELAHDKISDSLVKAQETNDTDAIEALTEQKENASDRLVEIYNASKREGTEAGRGLNARRMMAFRNFSLAAIETQARIAKGGEQLTAEEHKRVEDLSKRLIAAEKALDEYEQNAIKRVEKGVAKLAKQPAAKPETVQAKKARVLSFLDAQANAARERLKAKRGRAGGGLPFDPEDIADIAKIAASHIAHGIDASVQLVKDFGDAIKPHLDEILKQARAHLASSESIEPKQRAQETRLKGSIEKVKGKIEAQDFSPPAKREPIPLTPEAVKLKANLEELKKEYASMLARHKFENRTRGEKVKDTAKEVLNIPKQVMTAFDFSAVLRQGGFFAAQQPIETAKSLPSMFAAATSERKALEIDVALRNRELAGVGDKAKLELTNLDGPVSQHEEHIRSRWAEKIPGIKGSNRAFTTFLNIQRATTFDAMYRALPEDQQTPENAKAIANFINVGTGRGNVGRFGQQASAAANVLWSPRLLLSRFQLLAGQPLYRGSKATRAAIAKRYARSLGGLAAYYAIATLAGGDIGDDPQSSDFGKVKFGNTRVDPLAGLAQVTVLTSRLGAHATGDKEAFHKTDGTGREFKIGDLGAFLRSKLSPTIGLPLDATFGDFKGEKPGLSDLAPLSFQDIFKAMEDQGVPRGTALWILSVFGQGLSVHEPKPPKAK